MFGLAALCNDFNVISVAHQSNKTSLLGEMSKKANGSLPTKPSMHYLNNYQKPRNSDKEKYPRSAETPN